MLFSNVVCFAIGFVSFFARLYTSELLNVSGVFDFGLYRTQAAANGKFGIGLRSWIKSSQELIRFVGCGVFVVFHPLRTAKYCLIWLFASLQGPIAFPRSVCDEL